MIKHKFHAISCEREGKKFPSKLERDCYVRLKKLQEEKKILFFLRQVPFDLPGKSKHNIDYCVFTPENVIFIEAKGRDLPMGALKRKQVEELYGINIFVVKDAWAINEVVQTNR
jgi:hypothetical protein